MPKLTDAMAKVHEGAKKRPKKRRPYLDNVTSSKKSTPEPVYEQSPPEAKPSPVALAGLRVETNSIIVDPPIKNPQPTKTIKASKPQSEQEGNTNMRIK